jgi:hypothetical protein
MRVCVHNAARRLPWERRADFLSIRGAGFSTAMATALDKLQCPAAAIAETCLTGKQQ